MLCQSSDRFSTHGLWRESELPFNEAGWIHKEHLPYQRKEGHFTWLEIEGLRLQFMATGVEVGLHMYGCLALGSKNKGTWHNLVSVLPGCGPLYGLSFQNPCRTAACRCQSGHRQVYASDGAMGNALVQHTRCGLVHSGSSLANDHHCSCGRKTDPEMTRLISGAIRSASCHVQCRLASCRWA